MATLRQTLRGLSKPQPELVRGPGGILQEKTLQDATRQAGLSAAPLTPMAAEMTGASPQAAKMAGTPQQLKSALEQAAAPQPADLQTTLRRKQVRAEALAPEQQKMAKSADMQALGGLGDRVTNLVQKELSKTAAVDVSLSSDLDIIKKDPTASSQAAMDAMLRIAQSGQNLDKIAELVPEAASTIGALAGKAIRNPSQVTAAELLPELGYTPESLSALLNITPEQLQGYSIADLQNKINEVTSQEFTETQKIQELATSPERGQAERMLAREAGRELSAVGVRSTEADMGRLADEISSANQVSLFGEVRTPEQWLSDDEVSALIKEIVESPAGSQIRQDVKRESKDFYDFIQRNETALKDAAAALDTSTSRFKAIQQANKKLYGRLSDAAAKIFAPEATKLQSRELTASEIPVLDYLSTLSDTDRLKAEDELNKLQATNPTLAAEIAALSKEQVVGLGIGKPGSNYENMIKHNSNVDYISSIPETNGDALVSAAFADVGSVEAANARIEDNNALTALGYSSGVSRSQPIDPAKVKEDLLATNTKVSVADAAAGNVPSDAKPALGKPKYPDNITEQLIYATLRPVIKDGSLSAEEINDARGPISKLNWDDLLDLRKMADKPGAKIDKAALDNKLAGLRATNTAEQFILVGGADRRTTDPALDIDRWSKLLSADPDKVDVQGVKDLISRTAIGEFTSGRYRHVYMDGTLDRIKNLGLLTPEMVDAFNQTAADRRQVGGLTPVFKKSKYFYGIDSQGNPLPPPAPVQKPVNSKSTRR